MTAFFCSCAPLLIDALHAGRYDRANRRKVFIMNERRGSAFGALRWMHAAQGKFLVDRDGKTVSLIYDTYPDAQPFGEGCFALRSRYYYFIGPDGREVADFGPYRDVWTDPHLPIAMVEDRYSFEHVIDRSGRLIAHAPAHRSIESFKDGPGQMQWFHHQEKGYIGVAADGTFVGPFEDIWPFPDQHTRWCQRGGFWTLVGADGKTRGPEDIETGNSFFDERALVRVGGKLSFLKPDGDRAWNREYEEAYGFTHGRAWVREEGGLVLVDTEGQRVRPQDAYDDLYDNYKGPYAPVRKNETWYVVRLKDGARTPDEAFDEIERWGRQKSHFIVRKGSAWYLLDAETGSRTPYDKEEADHVALMRAIGGGGEWDD